MRSCAVAPSTYVPVGHTGNMRADGITRLCVSVAGICLTLGPGQAKLLTKRQREHVTWF